jgi:phosphoribosylaminoimidazolecarboxamide formyltransferase/IMP cyclohydrolase
VFYKDGLEDLVKVLAKNDVEIVSTGSTAKVIMSYGVDVVPVEEITGFAECLDGRVKTLHPNIHAGILADVRNSSHLDQLKGLDLHPFDLVVVNLYPFSETVASDASFEEIVEKIDIGGPSMVRGAAKNFANVAVVTSTSDYEFTAKSIANGGFTEAERFELARKAFSHTAAYDLGVAAWFNSGDAPGGGFASFEGAVYQKVEDLRYGENPHQRAALYKDVAGHNTVPAYGSIVGAKLLSSGKQMSYNNYLDAEAALRSAFDFERPTVAIVKHSNPCGIGSDEDIAKAHQKAFECDPVSAYGGVVASNRVVTLGQAQLIKPVFTEVVVAPGFEEDALALLLEKKNLRILELDAKNHPVDLSVSSAKLIEARKMTGGLLVQERDTYQAPGDAPDNWELVAGKRPSQSVFEDLKFAWRAVRSVKSNAILLAKDCATVGIGMGQVNRLDSCDLAIRRANTLGGATQGSQDLPQIDSPGGAANGGETTKEQRSIGAVAASDAFFPFADGLQKLIDAGVSAVVQPGGSIRDDEVIEAATKAGITMYFTGSRHFAH